LPEQSAPTPEQARRTGAAGFSEQSSSASFTSLELPIRPGRMQALGSRGREPRFYLRLGPEAGLTLVRVLRGGLELGECLGGLLAGRTDCSRLPPAPSSRILEPPARGTPPHRRLGDPGASALELFYESDCQGRTSASLMARRFLPGQSAPMPEQARLAGAAGVSDQSASASFTSLETPDPTWTNSKRWGRADANHGSI